jgi:endoglucanase
MSTTMVSKLFAIALAGGAVLISGCIPRQQGGGGAGAAGPAAAAAAEGTAEGKACPPEEGLIDDGEDNNNQVTAQKGRTGYWYTFVDKAGSTVEPKAGEAGGTFSMAPGGANGSTQAARVTGTIGNGNIVFAGMGFNFNDPKSPYDASKYKGVSFYAKKSPASTGKVRLKFPDVNTDPDGKACTECFNDFGIDLELTNEWQKYVIPFSGMRQMQGWGAPRPGSIEPSKVYGIQWQVNSPGVTYEIFIDDIQFTGCP